MPPHCANVAEVVFYGAGGAVLAGQLPAKALNVGFCDVPHGMTSYCNGLENTDKGKTLSGFGDKKTAGSGGTASGGKGRWA